MNTVRLALGMMLALAACRPAPERKLPSFDRAQPIAALDSLAGREVSVSGVVADPHDGTHLPLDDGTGRVTVALPEPVPLPVGTRLMAQGTVRDTPAGRVLEAELWLYDSTAVPVRSAGPPDHSER